MSRIDDLAETARQQGIRPWIGIKERLAREVVSVMARDTRAVLQGGAALHFNYGSPPRGGNLSQAALAVSIEELRQSLDGVLPTEHAAALDPFAVLRAAADILGEYQHAL